MGGGGATIDSRRDGGLDDDFVDQLGEALERRVEPHVTTRTTEGDPPACYRRQWRSLQVPPRRAFPPPGEVQGPDLQLQSTGGCWKQRERSMARETMRMAWADGIRARRRTGEKNSRDETSLAH